MANQPPERRIVFSGCLGKIVIAFIVALPCSGVWALQDLLANHRLIGLIVFLVIVIIDLLGWYIFIDMRRRK